MRRSQPYIKGCATWLSSRIKPMTIVPMRLQSSAASSHGIELQSMLHEERMLARELQAHLRTKDSLLEKKDEALCTKDRLLEKKDEALCTKDRLLEKKDADLRTKDADLRTKDRLLEKKDEDVRSLLEKKDADLRTKDRLLEKKDEDLTAKAALAAQLKLQQFELIRYKNIVNCRGALEFVASQIGLSHPGDEMGWRTEFDG